MSIGATGEHSSILNCRIINICLSADYGYGWNGANTVQDQSLASPASEK